MSEQNKALVRRWFERVWNQCDATAIDEMFPPEGQAGGFPTPDSVLTGPEAFKKIHSQFCNLYSDIRIDLDELLAEGDKVAVRWTASMTHTGDGLGFPPTGERVKLSGSSFLRCNADRLTEGWNYMDLTLIHLQLKDIAESKKQGLSQ